MQLDQIYLQLLQENEILTEAQLKEAVAFAETQNISLAESLIQKDFVSDENLGKLLSDYLKLPFIKLSKISIPEEILHIVPSEVVEKEKVIAYGVSKDKKSLLVALGLFYNS